MEEHATNPRISSSSSNTNKSNSESQSQGEPSSGNVKTEVIDKQQPSDNEVIKTESEAQTAMDIADDTKTEKKEERKMSVLDQLEEIKGVLKTAHPLVATSMESVADHITQSMKCTAEEEMYRLITVLLKDALQVLFTFYMTDYHFHFQENIIFRPRV